MSKNVGYLASSRRGSDCRSTVLLSKAFIDRVLCYKLIVQKQLDAARNSCLRVCLGLPRWSSFWGTVAEAGCLLQETARIHLLSRIHGKTHTITRMIENDNSRFWSSIEDIASFHSLSGTKFNDGLFPTLDAFVIGT